VDEMVKYFLMKESNITYDSGGQGPSERLYFRAKEKWCCAGIGTWWYLFYEPDRSSGAFGVGHPQRPPKRAQRISYADALAWVQKHKHLNEYIAEEVENYL
jgi:hypothetical protein